VSKVISLLQAFSGAIFRICICRASYSITNL